MIPRTGIAVYRLPVRDLFIQEKYVEGGGLKKSHRRRAISNAPVHAGEGGIVTLALAIGFLRSVPRSNGLEVVADEFAPAATS